MNYISGYDLEHTIKEYDFTKKAIINMDKVISSEDFLDMDVDMIFKYLIGGINLISFKDYLKRYIYKHSGLTQKFSTVTDDVYKKIITDSFKAHEAPFSFEPVHRRTSVIIQSWLKGDRIKRNSMFVIGFGLQMSDSDVSEFLKKVLYEDDFDYKNPREAVYCYCYRRSLPYKMAKAFLDHYETLDVNKLVIPASQIAYWENMLKNHTFNVTNDMEMIYYLEYLKTISSPEKPDTAHQEFVKLFHQAREVISWIYRNDYTYAGKEWNANMITAADLEKMLYCGIPLDQSGNLKKMSFSSLSSHFQNKRLSRQRIDRILKGKSPVNRFDIITLYFYVYVSKWEIENQKKPWEAQEEWFPENQYKLFLDKTNKILNKCGFTSLYPVNPYEAFVLMCLLTESPILSYTDIWEMSYEENM